MAGIPYAQDRSYSMTHKLHDLQTFLETSAPELRHLLGPYAELFREIRWAQSAWGRLRKSLTCPGSQVDVITAQIIKEESTRSTLFKFLEDEFPDDYQKKKDRFFEWERQDEEKNMYQDFFLAIRAEHRVERHCWREIFRPFDDLQVGDFKSLEKSLYADGVFGSSLFEYMVGPKAKLPNPREVILATVDKDNKIVQYLCRAQSHLADDDPMVNLEEWIKLFEDSKTRQSLLEGIWSLDSVDKLNPKRLFKRKVFWFFYDPTNPSADPVASLSRDSGESDLISRLALSPRSTPQYNFEKLDGQSRTSKASKKWAVFYLQCERQPHFPTIAEAYTNGPLAKFMPSPPDESCGLTNPADQAPGLPEVVHHARDFFVRSFVQRPPRIITSSESE
jgi:hypothetical protein